MLNFDCFDVSPDHIIYEGEYMYSITRNPDNSLTVLVEDLDENGDAYTVEDYAASSLSTAIQIIENLEAGVPE